jgi:ABC-2 type transport system ATP-binding protein
MTLVVKNIVKKFGSQYALNDVSFEINKGEVVGLIGPNGAGKSTLMKIITGFIPSDSGDVLINGKNVAENLMEVRRITGYLPENNPVYPDMYVREYLAYVSGLYKGLVNKKGKIDQIISETGLKSESHKKISELSKGYRQRVGIAQALVHDPEILILDESTSGLDPNQILEIRSLISRISKEKIVIISTHILQEVEAICSKVLIIRKGKIVADGKPGEISSFMVDEYITILVEFNKEPDFQKLKDIEGVIKIVKVNSNRLLIESDSIKDIRHLIFNFAVTNGLTVLSMQKKEKSLEEVFAELTRE